MAHTQHNQPRTPSAAHGGSKAETSRQSQDDPQRGQDTKITNSPRKRAPQAKAGKRHE